MNINIFKDFIVGLLFILIDVMIFQHLSIFGATPDPLLIYLLWLALKYDRTKLILFAAFLSFFQDAIFDFWGLNMFSKTLLLFMIYTFLNRHSENRLLIWQIALIIFVASIIHNTIFIGLSTFNDAYATGFIPIIFLVGNSLYTTLLGASLFVFKGN